MACVCKGNNSLVYNVCSKKDDRLYSNLMEDVNEDVSAILAKDGGCTDNTGLGILAETVAMTRLDKSSDS